MNLFLQRISLFCLAFLFAVAGTAKAQTGLDFLNIGPNAQSLGISEAHTAVPLGSASVFTNPANLMLTESSALGLAYSLWIADTQITQASASVRRERDVFGLGVLSSLIDDFEARQTPGPSTGSFSVQYLALTAAYARSVSFLSVGGSVSYLYEQLFQQNASGYAFSGGITGEFLDQRLRIASAITNAGRMGELQNERTTVPARWRTGFDVNAVQISTVSGAEVPVVINLSADFVVPLQEEFIRDAGDDDRAIESGNFLAFGLQAELYDLVGVRAGYRTGETARNWSFGASVNVHPVKFYYSFIPFETGFGMVHSIGLNYSFNL
ncbi:hypothetical protein CYPRO_1754 [Cyclonatronum proteinivorum]|uniref:PorV/PorQ family protein n=1 Tax=Cyclonatronum proteinivorum TaxID=1457365 RepID=A0A345UKK2_9BACT|nr:PorV/PorQ family protein [Cyclonatronum proteinivorum]AXJ01004.1 hypothetical protein CYPRO_1754 [Cyclonatronum proteinivorum]